MDSTKTAPGHVTPNLCFAFGGMCGSCNAFGTSEMENIDALFFMLVWDRYRFQKKRTRTRDTELVFLHPVGLWVTQWCIQGVKCRRTIFHARVGLVRFS
jgi:hypothetical protein